MPWAFRVRVASRAAWTVEPLSMASSTFWEPDSTPIQTSRAPARARAWAMRPVIRLTRDCMVKGVRQPVRSTASAKSAAHWASRAKMSSVNQM